MRTKGSKNIKPSKAQLYQALENDKNIEPTESKALPPSFGRI